MLLLDCKIIRIKVDRFCERVFLTNEARETHACLRPRLNDKAVFTESAYWETESSCFISPSVSAKSNTCALLSILSLRADFGMTTKPCCRLHRIKTWAEDLPCAFAIDTGIGSSRFLPRVRGL